MSLIGQAIDFCATFDPEILAQIKGASPEQLSRLEYCLKRDIGPLHREFLERLGGHSGWLGIGGWDISADGVANAHAQTSGTLAPGHDLLGVAWDEPFDDAYLVEHESGAPAVYAIPSLRTGHYDRLSRQPAELIAGSLPELLCRTALIRYRFTGMPCHAFFTQPESNAPLASEIDRAMKERRLEPAWFSDWMTRAFTLDGFAVLAAQRPGKRMIVRIGGDNETAFQDVGAILREQLGLQLM